MSDHANNQAEPTAFLYMGHFKTAQEILPMLDIGCRIGFTLWASKARPGDWLSALNAKKAWPVMIACVRPIGAALGPDAPPSETDDSR